MIIIDEDNPELSAEPLARSVAYPGGDRTPRLRWNGGYVVEKAPLQGERHLLRLQPEVDDSPDRQTFILYGERHSGHQDFLSWWVSEVEHHDMVVLLDGARPRSPLLVRLRSLTTTTGDETQVADEQDIKDDLSDTDVKQHPVLMHLDAFFAQAHEQPDAALTALLELAGMLTAAGSRLHVLIRGAKGLGDSLGQVAALLASFRAGEQSRRDAKASPICLVLTSTYQLDVNQAIAESGLQRVAPTYRLPYLNVHDIEELARRFPGDGERPSGPSADDLARIVDGTGGQPRLVHDVLSGCARGTYRSRDVKSALTSLRTSPPRYARDWAEDLRYLLDTARSPRARLLRDYVQGTQIRNLEQFSLSPEDWELYYAGWLGLRDSGATRYWGIRSVFHQSLARQVLFGMR